jgi:hypothetical protein
MTAAVRPMPDDATIDDAFAAWKALCALAAVIGVSRADELIAAVLAIAERHPDYRAFEAEHGGGFPDG